MRLVTFRLPSAAPGEPAAALTQVLAIIEAGDDALDRAYEAMKKAPPECVHAREQVTLMAPIPRPPQMCDCLCFELHLVQAFNVARKLKASRSPDPAAALAEMERTSAGAKHVL
ncbi:MAG TPA: hypothetical protein VGJ20_15925 [Xanthobacteraceae bacterium]|jgi:hypothetical protein